MFVKYSFSTFSSFFHSHCFHQFTHHFLALFLLLHFSCSFSFSLFCFNSCNLPSSSPTNISTVHTKSCKSSCNGNSCTTTYSPHLSVPKYGCSAQNVTYPGCMAQNNTAEVVCHCLTDSCNMPAFQIIQDGWSFPEIVLALDFDSFLNGTFAIANSSSSFVNQSSEDGTNITIRNLQDGIRMNELIAPLLNPDPSNSMTDDSNMEFPLVMVKPPNPTFDGLKL